MRELSNCNKRLYLSCALCAGGFALKQSGPLFRLFTAMLLPLGVIWLKSVPVTGSPVSEFLVVNGLIAVLIVGLVGLGGAVNGAIFDSRSGLMDKFNQYESSVLGVAHEG